MIIQSGVFWMYHWSRAVCDIPLGITVHGKGHHAAPLLNVRRGATASLIRCPCSARPGALLTDMLRDGFPGQLRSCPPPETAHEKGPS